MVPDAYVGATDVDDLVLPGGEENAAAEPTASASGSGRVAVAAPAPEAEAAEAEEGPHPPPLPPTPRPARPGFQVRVGFKS